MLTEEERKHIRNEEIFREEVRRELATAPQRLQPRFWPLLNSPFALWALSTLVVGIVSFGFARWEGERDEAKKTKELVRKLDLEIDSRLNSFDDELKSASDYETLHTAVAGLEDPRRWKTPHNFYHEFNDRTLWELLDDLLKNVDESSKLPVRQALEASQELMDQCGNLHAEANRTHDEAWLKKQKESLHETRMKLKLPRWHLSYLGHWEEPHQDQ